MTLLRVLTGECSNDMNEGLITYIRYRYHTITISNQRGCFKRFIE